MKPLAVPNTLTTDTPSATGSGGGQQGNDDAGGGLGGGMHLRRSGLKRLCVGL